MTVKTQNTMAVSIPPVTEPAELLRGIDRLADVDELRIYASGLRFVRPLGLCLLRALLHRGAERADAVVFEVPDSDEVHMYLARMDFYVGHPSNVVLSRPAPSHNRRDRSDALIELARIERSPQVERLMQQVALVSEDLGGPSVSKACAVAVAEATANVLEHADSNLGAFVAAQRYPGGGLELAVADLGIGFATSLAKNPAFRDVSDLKALVRSIEPGVSSIIGDAGRGLGLPALVEEIAKVHYAELSLRSGAAELIVESKNGKSEKRKVIHEWRAPGTTIRLRLEGQSKRRKL